MPAKRAARSAKAAKVAKPAKKASKLRTKDDGDWRDASLAKLRTLIKRADPEVVEEVKWRKPSNAMKGVPVWSHDGIICTGETYKDYVKLTFAQGAALEDPKKLFNAGFGGGTRRAIDLRKGETIDEVAFAELVREAVERNQTQG